ncbi:MAG: carbon-nitrogen hydrolase family protein [Pseudomonadota bacterium]
MPKIAILQMTSGIVPEANFEVIAKAAEEASDEGAEVLFTPEMAALLDRDRKRASPWISSASPYHFSDGICDLAESYRLNIVVGSIPVSTPSGKFANRTFYWTERGAAPYTYDKIHMFDVDLASGESWRESNAYEAGQDVVTIDDTPVGRLGLTICYDIRFPALFEELGRRKCDAIAIPAAFTVPTGKAHWHTLLKARAIEASAFVIAAAQVGKHEDGRETYGHSLVVDPWGDVLLDMGGEEPGLSFCDIDIDRIAEVRRQLPSLENKREIPK